MLPTTDTLRMSTTAGNELAEAEWRLIELADGTADSKRLQELLRIPVECMEMPFLRKVVKEGAVEEGADTRRDQEWEAQPWADSVTRSVTGCRKPMPVCRPPVSRILAKIDIRHARISSARK